MPKNIELVYSLTSLSVIAVFRLMEVVRRGSVNNYYAPTQTPQVQKSFCDFFVHSIILDFRV